MRVIDLAIKDLKQLLHDPKTAIFLVAMPVIFTLLFGFAFGGFGTSQEEDPRLPVGLIDQDGGRLGSDLRDLSEASEAIRLVALEGKDADVGRAEKQVLDGKLAALVIVPAGYSDKLLAGDPTRLAVIIAEGDQSGATAQSEIQAAALRLAGAAETARLSAQAYESRAGFAGDAARRQFVEEALAKALAAWRDPPLTVAVTQSGMIVTEEGSSIMQSGFSHTSPSMMVQFGLAGLMGAASILVLERKSRALRRLLTTPISRFQIVLGHYLAMVIMILAQFLVLAAFGQLFLRVPYLREPLATLLVMVASALWTAAVGLLIGVFAKAEEQAIIYTLIPMFVLGGMGGAWMPLEYTGKTFQAIGHLLPTAWAMDGFENIVVRGLGLESVLLPVAIMLGYAVLLFALAVWRFRFE
jgi:ABC-2 type transport system permease protein